MIRHTLRGAAAVAIVIACAGASSGEHAKTPGAADYVLQVEGADPICVKAESDCRVAIEAIRKGYLPDIPSDSRASCVPSPHCFSPESNCIAGFNCGKDDR